MQAARSCRTAIAAAILLLGACGQLSSDETGDAMVARDDESAIDAGGSDASTSDMAADATDAAADAAAGDDEQANAVANSTTRETDSGSRDPSFDRGDAGPTFSGSAGDGYPTSNREIFAQSVQPPFATRDPGQSVPRPHSPGWTGGRVPSTDSSSADRPADHADATAGLRVPDIFPVTPVSPGQPIAPDTPAPPVTAPPAADGADAPCPAAEGELLPAEICAAYGRLKPALGGFKVPAKLQLGDSTPVRFVIARDGSHPAEQLGDLPGNAREFPLRVARYVRAELLARSSGLSVTPRSEARQDLLTRPQAIWDWDVKATGGGTQRLTLHVSIEVGRDNSGKLWETSQDREIAVAVPPDAQLSGILRRSVPVVDDMRGAVIALTALVAALAGLWLALRRFGRRPESDPDPES